LAQDADIFHDGRRELPDAGLFVRDGIIEQDGSTEELPHDADVVLVRSGEWKTARGVLEIATRGGAAVLGRSDIGALPPRMCADFFSIDLNTVDYAGGLNDPIAATVYCAPQRARYTVVNVGVVGENGRVTTVYMDPVIEAQILFSHELASPQLTRSS
jgi:cytosine/adenosine deaminase-related metal-dependent hydrolase